MSAKTKIIAFLCPLIWIMVDTDALAREIYDKNVVRAMIGIQVKKGDQMLRAKVRDQLMAGDLIRIYVHPEVSSYVYVVHSDGRHVTLCNMYKQRIDSTTLVLPSEKEFYQVEGLTGEESLSVICSPNGANEIKELTALSNPNIHSGTWFLLERDLIEKGKLITSQGDGFPLWRGSSPADSGDPFLRELRIFSGVNVLVTKYVFKIKK